MSEFASDIAPFMSSEQRKGRLRSDATQQRALRLPFRVWRDELAQHGLIGSRMSGAGLVADELNYWSCNEQGRVSRGALSKIADALEPRDAERAALLRRVAKSGQEVECVDRASTAKPYYDLTVEDWNTYAAGRNGLLMIHNTGFSFSRLRPKGSMVRSTTGVASGPVSFMKLYDAFDGSGEAGRHASRCQHGHPACGSSGHPRIHHLQGRHHAGDELQHFRRGDGRVHGGREGRDVLRSQRSAIGGGRRPARCESGVGQDDCGCVAHGEPGCFFIDEANRYNPVPHIGSYEATNPCGEQMLLPYDVCNLGSVNVGHYVRDGRMDWDAFRRDIYLATHFLDNVIDTNRFPLSEIDVLAKRIRRIGLGVMGFADALGRLGIAYDSPEGVEFGTKVMAFLDMESKRESERLAHERGAFPEWARSIWGPDDTCARDASGRRIRPMQLLRNCNTTTVAPTGTISIIAGCSSGLEPLFAVAFMRNQAGVMMPDVNEDFVAVAKREGWYSDDLMERIAKEGRIDFPEVPFQMAACLRDGQCHQARLARADASCVSGALR